MPTPSMAEVLRQATPEQQNALMRYLQNSGEALGRIPDDLSEMGFSGALQGAGEALTGVGMVPPGIGAGARYVADGVSNAVNAAPKMSAALLGMLGMGATPSDAGEVKLRKSQQRQMEMERQRLENEAKTDGIRRQQDIEAADKERRMQAEFNVQQKAKEANTPFRERYKDAAGVLPAVGIALSAGLPFLLRGKSNAMTFLPGSTPGRIKSNIRATETAIANDDVVGAATGARTLQNIVDAKPWAATEALKEGGRAGMAAGAGGMLTAEANMFPDQYDWANLPDGPARERAKAVALDPMTYVERGIMGTLTGLSGYKAGDIIPRSTPDYAKAKSLSQILNPKYGEDIATVRANLNAARGTAPLQNGGPLQSGAMPGPGPNTPPALKGTIVEGLPGQPQGISPPTPPMTAPAPTASGAVGPSMSQQLAASSPAPALKQKPHPVDRNWDGKIGRWREANGWFAPGKAPD